MAGDLGYRVLRVVLVVAVLVFVMLDMFLKPIDFFYREAYMYYLNFNCLSDPSGYKACQGPVWAEGLGLKRLAFKGNPLQAKAL